MRAAVCLAAAALLLSATACAGERDVGRVAPTPTVTIQLPPPHLTGPVSLEAAIAGRYSVRSFAATPLTLAETGQLLWAAQGITRSWGGRTAPSAGALYPLEVYAVTGERVLHYLPRGHRAEVWLTGDLRPDLSAAVYTAGVVSTAPLVLVVTAVPARTKVKYGARGGRYVDMEAGHAAQNVLLEAVALGLGGVPMGGFDDGRVADALRLRAGEVPEYVIPVGHSVG